MSLQKKSGLLDPFRVAFRGVVFTFRTQRHMRFHLYVVLIIILLGMFMNLGQREMLVLLFTVSLVVVAEMFNSAIEATVDLVQPTYHPLAKFAKDISAGAVLLTTIMALTVAGLLFLGEGNWEAIKINLTSDGIGLGPVPRLGLGSVVVFVIVVIGKGLGKRGQILRGGLVSGHAAYGFFFAVSTIFLTESALTSAIAILLAGIIAQSRYEAKIHSIAELSLGAGVGTVLALAVFSVMPR
ncbi:MAG: diacylglycerol kinase [Fimbriimonas sp.]